VCDIVSHPFQSPDEDLDFVKHAIHKARKPIKGIVCFSRRQSFPEFTIYDALDLPVNFLDTPLCTNTQKYPRCKTETQRRDQPDNQCASANFRYTCEIFDISADN
jgi:hypothetical protein